MLELDFENLKQFKTNLLNRKIPFKIEKKRNEIIFVSNGKKIAKAESKNTISHSKKDETIKILSRPKEYKWINFEIKSLEDLIVISKEYGTKYSKDYEYPIDLEQLSKMTVELESLNKLVGLSNIKTQIVDLILYYSLKLDNKNYDLLHTVIEGEPGTGKTELAEKLAKIYLKMGILKKDIFKKVRRSDLIAGYLGQTALKEVIPTGIGFGISEIIGGALAVETGGASLAVVPLLVNLATRIGTFVAGHAGASAAQKNLLPEAVNKTLEQGEAQHPTAAMVGGFLPFGLYGGYGLSTAARKEIGEAYTLYKTGDASKLKSLKTWTEPLVATGFGAGIEGVSQAVQGEFDPARILISGFMMPLVTGNKTRLGKAVSFENINFKSYFQNV